MPSFGKTGLPTSHGRLKPEWNDCRIVLPFSHSLPTENVPKLYDTIELLIIFIVTSPVVYICLQKAIQGRHASKKHQHFTFVPNSTGPRTFPHCQGPLAASWRAPAPGEWHISVEGVFCCSFRLAALMNDDIDNTAILTTIVIIKSEYSE